MAQVSRSGGARFQINVPLDDEHWHIALLQLALRDGKSVPQVLRPVIINHLRRQLAKDQKLAAAVDSMEGSMADAQEKRRERRNLAPISRIPPVRRSQGGRAARTARERPPSA